MKHAWLVLALGCIPPLAASAEPAWRRAAFEAHRGIVTAMAPLPGGTAVGTSAGGILLFQASSGRLEPLADPGARRIRRVHSLAWGLGGLWIASDAGMHRWDPASKTFSVVGADRPGGAPAEVRSVAVVDRTVWLASARAVWCYQPGKPESWREWAMPFQDVPGSFLHVGSRLLLGTETKGLLILDSASGVWVRLGRADGLSSDQVVGLEWVGAEVFVGTPEGIDLFDLSTQKVRPAFPGIGVSWMTQSNGNLLVETEDGLLRIDAAGRKTSTVALASGARPSGALLARGDRLTVAVGAEILDRPEPTLLGEEPLTLTGQGFALGLSRRLPDRMRLVAHLRIPEWPDAMVPLVASLSEDRKRVSIVLPDDVRGRVQIDLVASGPDSAVQEYRSLEAVADRTEPVLSLESARSATRDSVVEIRGGVSGAMPLSLVRQPGAVAVAVGADGLFRERLGLSVGANVFRWALTDALGNVVRREAVFRRDLSAPRMAPPPPDTVTGDFARVRVKLQDEGPVAASVRGPGQARVVVFDSFLVLEARSLAAGPNQFQVVAVDEAGNSSRAVVNVLRTTTPQAGQASSWAIDGFRPFYRPLATDSTEMRRGVSVIRYAMVEGETLCGVAEQFYGSQLLAPVLIQWNGFADSSQWRRMPVGTLVDIPVWRDIDHRDPDVRGILESFPWDRLPSSRRLRK